MKNQFTEAEWKEIITAVTCHGTSYIFSNEKKGREIYELADRLRKIANG